MLKNKIIFLFFISILFISIGFSSLDTVLTIKGAKVELRKDSNVRITNISLSNTQNGAIAKYEEYYEDSLDLGFYLPNDEAEITYTIEVKNFGNVIYGIKEITLNQNNLDIEISEGVVNNVISNGETTLGITKNFDITFKRLNSDTSYTNVKVMIDFRSMHQINLLGSINKTYYAFDKNVYSINIDNINNYYFETDNSYNIDKNNNLIELFNISNDLNILVSNVENNSLIIEPNTYQIITSDISIDNPMDLSTFLNRENNGTSFSKLKITKLIINVDYSITTGKPHTLVCNLMINNQVFSQNNDLKKNVSNDKLTYTFDNIEINYHDTFSLSYNLTQGTNDSVTILNQIIDITYE